MAIIYMYRWMVLLLVWAVFSPIGARAAFIVDDFTKPALTCAPFLIQWQGGTAPWTLASDSAVLEDLGTFKVTSFNWNVDLTAGTSVLVQIQDATGAIAISKVLTVQAGSTDCALTTVGNPQTSTSTRETTATQAATTTKQTTTAKPPPPPPPGTTSSTAADTTSSPTRATATAPSQSQATQRSSSQSSVALPSTSAQESSPSATPVSTSITSGPAPVGSTQSPTGAYSTTAPEALGAVKSPAPTGVILGVLIPGLLLLVFVCLFLFRRRRRPSTAGREELSYDSRTTRAWFMRPAYHPTVRPSAPPRVVSYGIQSSGSYRTDADSEDPLPVPMASEASSSISRLEHPEFASQYDSGSTGSTAVPSAASGNSAERMGAFRFPNAPPPQPPAY